MEYDGRHRCLRVTLVIMSSILGVFLIFSIGFGVASGGDGCACNDDKCCVVSAHWCGDQCYCKAGRDTYVYDEDDDDMWKGYCDERSSTYGAYVAFLVLTIITGIATAIIGCCMCCPCCQSSRVIVSHRVPGEFSTPVSGNQQPTQYGYPVSAVPHPSNSDFYERTLLKV